MKVPILYYADCIIVVNLIGKMEKKRKLIRLEEELRSRCVQYIKEMQEEVEEMMKNAKEGQGEKSYV